MLMEAEHDITDRYGDHYRVHSERDTGWSFHLWHGDSVVGYMNCIEQPPVLLVGDFKLYDAVQVRETALAKLWRKLLRHPCPVRNYRNRGLGTALLALLSELAKSSGFRRLEGWISDVDTNTNPGLPDWYRRRGFQVTNRRDGYPHQVATIRKDL